MPLEAYLAAANRHARQVYLIHLVLCLCDADGAGQTGVHHKHRRSGLHWYPEAMSLVPIIMFPLLLLRKMLAFVS